MNKSEVYSFVSRLLSERPDTASVILSAVSDALIETHLKAVEFRNQAETLAASVVAASGEKSVAPPAAAASEPSPAPEPEDVPVPDPEAP